MKKILLLIFILPLFSYTSDSVSEDFIGKWIGDDKGQIGVMIFDKDGYVSIEIQGEVLGGKEFERNGKKGSMTYEIRPNKDVFEVDFILTILDTNEQKKLLGIAKLKDKNNMVFAMSFKGERPTEFNENNAINLKKVN